MPRGTPTCIRVARKEHRCTERDYHTIKVGDRYLYAECPPEHEMNRSRKSDPGGRRWTYIRACLRCANEFGLHASDTRKQLEQANAQAVSQGRGLAPGVADHRDDAGGVEVVASGPVVPGVA